MLCDNHEHIHIHTETSVNEWWQYRHPGLLFCYASSAWVPPVWQYAQSQSAVASPEFCSRGVTGVWRGPKFVVTKPPRSESHLALVCKICVHSHTSGGHVPHAWWVVTPLPVCVREHWTDAIYYVIDLDWINNSATTCGWTLLFWNLNLITRFLFNRRQITCECVYLVMLVCPIFAPVTLTWWPSHMNIT